MSKWSDQFKDSRWQKKRLEIMERDDWACQSCGAKGEGVTLNVHHIYYESGRAPWVYDDGDLVTWCQECHGVMHQLLRILTLRICHSEEPGRLVRRLIGYSDAYAGPCMDTDADYWRGYADCSAEIGECTVKAICKANTL